MPALHKITIGTRGSKLALAQTKLVADALTQMYPEVEIATKIITTKGDVDQSPIPLDTVGKAWFTEEIEQALLDGEIDLAVHSLKDLPPDLPPGLTIIPALPRADTADVLVSKSGASLADLPPQAVIGTDSARRKALILALRPDLIVQSIRGNIDTRLKKLGDGNYAGIVIAAAGLERLGLGDRITERFDPTLFVPAPGQGILAVEIKKERTELFDMFQKIVHAPTAAAAEIEQAFSNEIGGGCKLPIGCYADVHGNNVTIYGVVGNMDGTDVVRKSTTGRLSDGPMLARKLAKEF